MKRDEIARLLPDVFQRTVRQDNPLGALLDVMETQHQPSELILESIEDTFNPYKTPDRFVPMLSRWLDLDRFFPPLPIGASELPEDQTISTGLGRMRELINVAAYLSQWRGTAKGLKRFLETAMGINGFELNEEVLDPDGLPKPFFLLVRAPKKVERHKDLIERIVEQEKPAYVQHKVEFY